MLRRRNWGGKNSPLIGDVVDLTLAEHRDYRCEQNQEFVLPPMLRRSVITISPTVVVYFCSFFLSDWLSRPRPRPRRLVERIN